MEAVSLVIVIIVALVRAISAFARWAARSLQRLGASGEAYTPLQPLPPQEAALPTRLGAGGAAPRAAVSAVVASRPDSPAVRTQEPPAPVVKAIARTEAQFPTLTDDTTAPPSTTSTPLFGTTSDLVRAFILHEVLGPPLSQRKRSPPPQA